MWKRIRESDKYFICEDGTVRNMERELKPFGAGRGREYKAISLSFTPNVKTTLYIHRLVAEHFIPKEEGKDFVNHKDGNKSNNHRTNLEWCSAEENTAHARKEGLIQDSGTNNSRSKFTRDEILLFREEDKNGVICSEIAKKYGHPHGTIYNIVKGNRYKNVK